MIYPVPDIKYYFIDETGSPDFYGKRGKPLMNKSGYCPILIIGMIETRDKEALCRQIVNFQKELISNDELKDIYSLHQPEWFLHARGDHPAVLTRFFNYLAQLSFRTYIVIARKKLKRFIKKHNNNTGEFYFDLIKCMMRNRFRYDHKYELYLSKGHKASNKIRFSEAINSAIKMYKKRSNHPNIKRRFTCEIVSPKSCPELSVIDYTLWALQRYILHGDSTYYDILKEKYTHIYDIYATGEQQIKHCHKEQVFTINKAPKFGKIVK